jgi:hypothetical protein
VHRLAAFGGGALRGRTGKRAQSPETLRQPSSDFGIFLGLERLAAVVMEGQKYLDQMHRKPLAQPRSIPNMKSSATVTAAEISNDPRQPNRFEKKKNML